MNFTYINSETLTNIQNKIYENITDKNLSKFTDHILHEDNFDYTNVNDLIKYKDTPVNLGEIFKNWSINKKHYTRHEAPQMPQNITINQLNSRRKLEILNYPKNKNSTSTGERMSRIYRNKNLRHSSYSSQSHTSGITNSNIKNLTKVNNSLIFSGQKLNTIRVQTLHSNNGGNLRTKTGNNYTIITNPNDHLIGVQKKVIYHETKKHPLIKEKLPILH